MEPARVVIWSASKAKLYLSCPRALYLAETHAREGHLRAPLASLAEIVGVSVHRAISSELRKHRPGTGFDAVRAAENAMQLVDSMSMRLDPRALKYGGQSGSQAVVMGQRRAKKLLLLFGRFVWPRYSEHAILSVERRAQLDVDSVPVVVRPDLVTRAPDGTIVVTDWKTYADPKPDEELLQVGTYILWARDEFAVPLEMIEGRIVTLPNGETRSTRGSAEATNQLVRRIEQDASSWNVLAADRFPPRPDAEKCSRCSYLYLCPPGIEAVRSATNHEEEDRG